MFELRDYQKEAVGKGLDFFNSDKKGGILVLPTGSGKSLIIASIAKELKGNTIVFQPTKEILEQNLAKMEAFNIKNVKVFSASCGQKDIGKLTLATIGSVKNKKELFNNFQWIIIDECHLVNHKGGMYKDFIEQTGNKVLGLTATPYRMQAYRDWKTQERMVVAKFLHRTRPRIFSEILYITQVEELYAQNYLCQVEYAINKGYNHSAIKLNSTGADFDQRALKSYNQKVGVLNIIKNEINLSKANHILVFVSSVDEATRLEQELSVISAVVSAKTKKDKREQILKDFIDGEIRAVINVGTLTTGFDFPALDCVILGRPTQSVALYYQMMGRGLRPCERKEKVRVIDVCGNVPRFGFIEKFEIIEEKKGLHRLKSNTNFLTGYDFVHNKDVEKTNYKGLKETSFSGDVLTFGKFQGQHVSKIDNDYLDWVLKTFTDGKWKDVFQKEKKRREKSKREESFQTHW